MGKSDWIEFCGSLTISFCVSTGSLVSAFTYVSSHLPPREIAQMAQPVISPKQNMEAISCSAGIFLWYNQIFNCLKILARRDNSLAGEMNDKLAEHFIHLSFYLFREK